MPENTASNISPYIRVRHRGRGSQMWIYLGKLLRMFLYQNDWKVLPMSALIAGLVGMVIRNRMFLNMEGSLMGAFALVMVCIWNGCFNSIQVVCRERDVIKREHRSGMHISSYIASHMVYQALLCLLQTGVTLYVTKTVGIRYPSGGLFTRWYIVDFGISMFLISYASDMLSLWVSCLRRVAVAPGMGRPADELYHLQPGDQIADLADGLQSSASGNCVGYGFPYAGFRNRRDVYRRADP